LFGIKRTDVRSVAITRAEGGSHTRPPFLSKALLVREH